MEQFAFPPETIAYLRDLGADNTKAWFDANRDRYENYYLLPAKELVTALAPALAEIVPGIAAEPRVKGSIFRINRDVRFSKDKTPYKDHLDLWFWEGERRTATSGLFLRIAPAGVIVGAGSHGFDPPGLARYRHAVIDPTAGPGLAAIVERLEHAGHDIGGQSYSRTPRGFSATGAQERLLRHGALYVDAELPVGLATDPAIVPTLLKHWRTFAPLHMWLIDHVA